jgi:hypothetical protein
MAALAGIKMTPASIHGKMRFPVNSGQPKAVKSKPGLGGNAAGPPNSRQEEKGRTGEILWKT